MASKRNIEMDVLRGIAIIAVFLIHISAEIVNASSTAAEMDKFYLIVNQLARFAVPAFLLLSGLGLALSNRKEKYGSFLWRRVSKLLTLYLIWSTFYYLIFHFREINLLKFISETVTGGTYYHLYYVPVIIMFYIIFPALKTLSQSNFFMIAALSATILVQWADEIFGVLLFKDALNILNWLFYFVFGIWLAGRYEQIKLILNNHRMIVTALFVSISIGVVIESYFSMEQFLSVADATTSMRPMVILYTVIFVAMMIAIPWRKSKLTTGLQKLADLSYGMYLSHAFFLTGWSVIAKVIGIEKDTVIYLILTFSVVLVSSVIATMLVDWIIERIKNLRQPSEVINS